MIFVILVVAGAVGIIGTLWISSGSLRYAENQIARGNEWFIITPEKIESVVTNAARSKFREILKIILKWAIKKYRETTRDVQIRQEIKKRVRAFLYDHHVDGSHKQPSAVWKQLQHTHNKPIDPIISPDEIITGSE